MLKNGWKKLSFLGWEHASEGEDQRRWVLTNRVAVVFTVVCTLSLLTWPAYIHPQTGEFQLYSFLRIATLVILCGLCLILNARGYIRVSKLLLVMGLPSVLIGYSLLEKSFIPIDLFWMPIMAITHPVVPHLLFDSRKEKQTFWASIGYCVLLWAGVDQAIMRGMGDGHEVPAVFVEHYVVYKSLFLYFFIFINLGLFYFSRTNQRYEAKLESRLHEIEEQKNRIALQNEEMRVQRDLVASQNEELVQQQQEVQKINENLEFMVQQRTHELESQNHQLAEYAYINGHILRGPLCRVQGLIYLMELSDKMNAEDPMYLHLKESVDEFGEVVTRINHLIEEGEHFDRYDFAQEMRDASAEVGPENGAMEA